MINLPDEFNKLNARHFEELNAKQREAMEHRDGPLLVVAGAGTGKTRVITHRIAHLIANGVVANQILAVTFTNKAASEMRERVTALLCTKGSPSVPEGLPFVGTFHSLGVHILRESGRAVGVERWFAIFDRDDSKSLVRKCLKEQGYDPKQFEPGGILSAISRAKGNLTSREQFVTESADSFYADIVARVWREYEKELQKQGALDFDDLLVKTTELLREHEVVRKRYQSQWRYLHVDEYQDTNKAQYEMIKLLAGDPPSDVGKNVCVVGDHDQLIYAWRGASIENIMGFEKDFPGAKVVILEENYRSTSNILDAANSIIAKNENRKDKNLFTSIGPGEKISIYEAFDPSDEAHFVTHTISKLTRVAPEQIAVLYRANFQSRALEEAFLEAGVPYTVLGTRFFERSEVKDILAYVKAALNQSDKISFARATSTPRRGIGEKSLENYFATGQTNEKLQSFLILLKDFNEKLRTLTLSESLKYIVKTSGYEAMLKKIHPSISLGASDEGLERLENIQELVNLAGKYKSLNHEEALEKFLTDAGLVSDQDTLLLEERLSPNSRRVKNGVRLMTVHAAKGLEFEHVFIVGLEQDLFPHKPFDFAHSEPLNLSQDKSEEERRLFYVALTRAKKRVYLSWCQIRQIYGNQMVRVASEYLRDLPSELLQQPNINLVTRSPSRKIGLLPDIEDLEY